MGSRRARLVVAWLWLAACTSPPASVVDAGTDAAIDVGPDAHATRRDAAFADAAAVDAPTIDAGTDAGPCGDCSASPGSCLIGRCDVDAGRCVFDPKPEGSACGTPTDCTPTSACNATGTCVPAFADFGAACDDGDACTIDDSCDGSGVCTSTPIDCSALDGPCTSGLCDAHSGSCVAFGLPECAPCGPDAYCVTGACELASSGGLAFDLSHGVPLGWRSGGDAPWQLDPSVQYMGHPALRAGPIGDGQRSVLSFTVNAPSAAVRLAVRTSTEAGWDVLTIPGMTQLSGEHDWRVLEVPLDFSGTITLTYQKDASAAAGSDTVWVADIGVVDRRPPPPIHVVGDVIEDFERADLPPEWTQSGDAPWSLTTEVAFDGLTAIVSGDIGDAGSSAISFTVTVPPTADALSVQARTDSEANYDFFELMIDGAVLSRASGPGAAWIEIGGSVSPGPHTVTLRYRKDISLSVGRDTVWVDQLVVGTAATPPPSSVCAP